MGYTPAASRPAMSDSPARPSLWPTRLLWAGLGSAATVLVMLAWPDRNSGETSGATAPSATAEHSGPAPQPDVGGPSSAGPEQGAGSTGSPSTAPTGDSSTGTPSDSTTGALDPTAGDTATAETDDLSGLPEIPLPRMPGTRFMRRFREPTEDGTGWIIRLTLSIPASGTQVETFYRTAARDQGLKVWGGGPAGASIADGYRGTLRGRAHHATAEIIIRQKPGRLGSVVRIIWTTRD